MSCEDDLAVAWQSVTRTRQAIADLTTRVATLQTVVVMLRGAGSGVTVSHLEESAPPSRPATREETRIDQGLASEAALYRDIQDMEERLDKLEAR